ncbi:hypothetical protein G15_0252 [Enterococcus avium]|nr:hypothetical protein G15_0252 [Enterococcus avium]
MGEVERYYSENPEEDIWINLKHYSFVENINKYFNERNIESNEELTETISGSILQAFEYFQASRSSTIQTTPLLLYYGATNLLYGAACLIEGEVLKVNGHGMKLINQDNLDKRILSNKIKLVDPNYGGLGVYLKSFSGTDLASGTEWTIMELLGSIPEISHEFINLLSDDASFIVPLEKVISDAETTIRVNLKKMKREQLDKKLENIPDFKSNYHVYEVTQKKEAIFRTKLNGDDLYDQSYLNQYYFPIAHNKRGKLISYDSFIFEFIALYSLATICRYHPNVWTPFVRTDNSGEINFIEKFLISIRRYFPNYVLDKIQNTKHFYSNEFYSPRDKKRNLSESDIEKRIEKILRRMGID